MSVSSDVDSDVEDITPANNNAQADDPNAGLPALFWDSIPDNAEDHPDYIALKALDEETTPEERAENFKVGCGVVGVLRRRMGLLSMCRSRQKKQQQCPSSHAMLALLSPA